MMSTHGVRLGALPEWATYHLIPMGVSLGLEKLSPGGNTESSNASPFLIPLPLPNPELTTRIWVVFLPLISSKLSTEEDPVPGRGLQ